MPNWCSTSITFYSLNHNIIHEFHDRLEKIVKTPFSAEVHDASWIGNVLMHAGYSYGEIVQNPKLYCRGWIQWISDCEENDENYYSFSLSVEDAWSPHVFCFRASIERMYPNTDIRIAWVAEEPGCELFYKFDPDFLFYREYEYNVDTWVPNESCWEKYPELIEGDVYTLEQLKKYFKRERIEDIIARADDISEAMQEEFGDGFYQISPFEEAEDEEY